MAKSFLKEVKCAECGNVFLAYSFRSEARFCSNKCYRSIGHRIWESVSIQSLEGCWNWTGLKDRNGYGNLVSNVNGKKEQRANRVSWIFFRGGIPEGLCVLHRCDNPSCVNPDHLFLGTNGDNMKDKTTKGRNNAPRGERAGGAKLTVGQVLEIRRRYAAGDIQRQIALDFGVGYKAINKIVHRQRWAHV